MFSEQLLAVITRNSLPSSCQQQAKAVAACDFFSWKVTEAGSKLVAEEDSAATGTCSSY